MGKIIVRGGKSLSGTIKVSGAKNAVLPIIAASLLGQTGISTIQDAPPLDDVRTMNALLRSLGCQTESGSDVIRIDATSELQYEAPYELVCKMRASFLVMGPLLARMGRARIPLPGGCAIGTRPIDQHLKGFEAMGAEIAVGKGYIEVSTPGRLQGAQIYLDVASVGATENIMMAATLAEGTTYIENAAMEPEIVDLANYLNAMGAVIRGAGTGIIRIDGVKELHGCTHTVIPDRIEAGTYMIAAAITQGTLMIEGALPEHLRPLISKLREMGVHVEEHEDGISVTGPERLTPADIKTLPYPGFPTDLQSQMMALHLKAEGTSLVTETVFENRFMHVEQFKQMNAQIKVDGRTAVIHGGSALAGASVRATDLRAGAALILAALIAEGETEITDIHHIARGYVDVVGQLARVGANIQLIEDAVIVEAAAEVLEEREGIERKEAPLFAQPTWA